MIGRDISIDVSLQNIWQAWYIFRRGKKRTADFDAFSYNLEANFFQLYQELTDGSYKHGSYKSFPLTDTKKRIISVASLRDRVIHRLLYDYLIQIFDRTFIYDAWSCRKNKGLLGAILRTQQLLMRYPNAYVWRGDITKFFDSVDHQVLKKQIKKRVSDLYALQLIDNIIDSYSSYAPGKGMPIGNLTSQVFTNVYLHELDFYISHTIKPLGYVRYGDDFILLANTLEQAQQWREHLIVFIDQILQLSIHKTNNIIVKTKQGVHFLGCDIYPTGRRLRKRVYNRVQERLNFINCSSYRALFLAHSKQKMIQWFDWNMRGIMDQLCV
ncbi:group II intron reverse transcriptase domain-containing protein [Candidatus Woesebacteria bacterium]|nr:group II intron reverse transcriptase domain-containing protein [Candidatus Woesebacteria bacterium]